MVAKGLATLEPKLCVLGLSVAALSPMGFLPGLRSLETVGGASWDDEDEDDAAAGATENVAGGRGRGSGGQSGAVRLRDCMSRLLA